MLSNDDIPGPDTPASRARLPSGPRNLRSFLISSVSLEANDTNEAGFLQAAKSSSKPV